MSLRIAHLMAGAHEGGAERFFERLTIAQAAHGDVILPIIRKDQARLARLRGAGLAPQTAFFGGGWDIFSKPLLARRLQKFAPDIAIAWMGRAASHTPRGAYVLAGRLGGYYDLSRFAACDHLLANTHGLKKWIVGQGFAESRTHVVPNFVPDHSNAPPAALPVPIGAKTILSLGRLHRNKGFDVLIAAVARLPGVHAVIAGAGPEEENLKDLVERAGLADRIHFLGWREDVTSLLAACDVFVCSSRSEPLGNMVLDAFSAQKPVVAAMAEGPMELIETGKTGILVPIDSAIALASGIEAILDAPERARQMAVAGRAFYDAHFTEDAVLQKWRDTLLSLDKF
jgi:glycosyltransferase involved in cell wall biosynthesis